MAPVKFEVNGDTCISCGLCARDCVCGIIEMEDTPSIPDEKRKFCIHCGHCQAICPTRSITLDDIDPASLEAAQKPASPEIIRNIVRNRRSVRHFHAVTPDQDLLENIIHLASWAPTARNARQIAYIIYNGREKVEKLIKATVAVMEEHNWLPEVAAAIHAGNDILFRGAPCVIIAHAPESILASADCATALATMELALPSFGFASCWAGYFTTTCAQGLPAGIHIPLSNTIYGALMLGKPAVKYKSVPFRAMPQIQWI